MPDFYRMSFPNPETHKLDNFGFIDYKQPLNKQQDMRTSTYFGNKYVTDTMLGNTINCKFKETPPYREDVTLAMHRQSDYKTNYTWKVFIRDEYHCILSNIIFCTYISLEIPTKFVIPPWLKWMVLNPFMNAK